MTDDIRDRLDEIYRSEEIHLLFFLTTVLAFLVVAGSIFGVIELLRAT